VVEEEAVETVEAAEVGEVEDLQVAEVAEAEVGEGFPLFNHSHRWEHQEDKHETLNQWDNSPPSSTETEPNQKDSLIC
jgi:hypothetical protein